jgi:hypothetical protein
VQGPRLAGTILPGGADWQFVRPDGVLSLEAPIGSLDWLSKAPFIGLAERRPGAAIVRVHLLK